MELAVRKINRRQVAAKEAPSRVFRELVSHRKLGAKGIALRLVRVTPVKKSGPRHPHSHRGMEEVIYVQKGSGKAWVDGEVVPVKAGDAILIPAGKRHMMINTGRKPLELFCAFSAADPENRYKEYPEISYPGE
jgi:mannose-6-phosphate isomerase-like protein (cupin superfamily)